MNADALDRLRAADPAASLPEEDAERREQLRRAIVLSSTDGPERAGTRRPRRRVLLAAIVAGAILLLCGTAVYAAKVVLPPLKPLKPPPMPAADTLMTAGQVHAEYRLWTHKIALPPGVKWRRERLPKGPGGYGDTYGGNTGTLDAIEWALSAWSREWIGAAKAQDEVRIAAAAAAMERLSFAIPEWHEGMTENQGGWDSSSIESLKADIAAAKQGDLRGLQQFAGAARTAE
jgi:hypothetical protein